MDFIWTPWCGLKALNFHSKREVILPPSWIQTSLQLLGSCWSSNIKISLPQSLHIQCDFDQSVSTPSKKIPSLYQPRLDTYKRQVHKQERVINATPAAQHSEANCFISEGDPLDPWARGFWCRWNTFPGLFEMDLKWKCTCAKMQVQTSSKWTLYNRVLAWITLYPSLITGLMWKTDSSGLVRFDLRMCQFDKHEERETCLMQ